MRIESLYTLSYLIGMGPRGETAVHRTLTDQQGHVYHTVERYPYYSYSAAGAIEKVNEIGKNIDVRA